MTRILIGTAEVENGVAETTYTIPSDLTPKPNYVLYATYKQNDNYMLAEGYNSAAIRKGTNITVDNVTASKSTGNETKYATLTAHITSNNENVNEGAVQFQVGGANVGGQITVQNGVATFQYPVPTNATTTEITASFLETDTYGGSVTATSGTLKIRDGLTVTVEDVSANLGTDANIIATITDINGENITSGEATLYVEDTLIGEATTVQNGQATFTYAVANNATLGGHPIKVVYAENDDYDETQGTGNLIVRTPTVLSPENISANEGQTGVPIVVQVKDSNNTAIPEGTVNITVGDGETVPATVNASGIASITYDVPSNTRGTTINFTAEYVENTNYQGSVMETSGVITVRKGTTIVVSNIDAELGDEITLHATITDDNGEAVNEGTVEYSIE